MFVYRGREGMKYYKLTKINDIFFLKKPKLMILLFGYCENNICSLYIANTPFFTHSQ